MDNQKSEATSQPLLHKRSDGWVEDAAGNFAVNMNVMTRRIDDNCEFIFQTGAVNDPVRIVWPVEHKVQLFPGEIAVVLVRRGWASQPIDSDVVWLEDFLAMQAAAIPAPETAPKAPETAPPAPEVAGASTTEAKPEKPAVTAQKKATPPPPPKVDAPAS